MTACCLALLGLMCFKYLSIKLMLYISSLNAEVTCVRVVVSHYLLIFIFFREASTTTLLDVLLPREVAWGPGAATAVCQTMAQASVTVPSIQPQCCHHHHPAMAVMTATVMKNTVSLMNLAIVGIHQKPYTPILYPP